MKPPSTLDQHLTPQVLAWLQAQVAHGRSSESMVAGMLAAGWDTAAVAHALQLGSEEMARLAVPALALPVSGDMVDAGDKWVTVKQLFHTPDVLLFSNLLSAGECDALIAEGRPRLSRSLTVDTQTGAEALNAARTSEGMFFMRGENEVVQRVEARIARVLGWPRENGEGLQVLRYGPGAEYKPHHDFFDPAEPGTPALLERGGQRVATLIMYLNQPEKGGATDFPDLGLRVEPRRGQAVFFNYALPGIASRTLHGGEPVLAGEKWIATKWLRQREFN